jgi:DNA primase
MIDIERFTDWAKSRFKDNIVVKGKEIRINTIFEEGDTNHHLWCSPSGGKKKRKNGVYHCFKTNKKGSLIKLVMLVDNCEYDEAIETLKGETSLRYLERQLEDFLNKKEEEEESKKNVKIELPPDTFLINNLKNWWKKKAEDYLKKRKIPIDNLFFCTNGNYKGRIIIPYYDKEGNLIYWNSRSILNAKFRYLGPPKEIGVGKSDVIYMKEYPTLGSKVYLCEGEFNAMSLNIAGLYGAACGGKTISEKQALLLKDYKTIICLDRDKAGYQGTSYMSAKISSFQTSFKSYDKLSFVRPPEGFKDWNEMLVKDGPGLLKEWIKKAEKTLDIHSPFGTTGDLLYLN